MASKFDYVFIVLVVFLIAGVFFVYLTPLNENKIPVRFYLSNQTGFDLTTEELHFGSVTLNHSSVRILKIDNFYNKKIEVIIRVSEGLFENVIASESRFYLESGESKEVVFTLFTDGLTEFGEYTGEIVVVSKRANILNRLKFLN